MNRILVAVLPAALVLCGSQLLADDKAAPAYTIGALTVSAPWTRATPKSADAAAGYLAVTNTGKDADRLLGGSAEIAGRFEMHAMATLDGVMTMRALPSGVEIKPGETVEFKPGASHIMMTGLKAPIKQGDKIKGTLLFEKAGVLAVEFTAAGIGAVAPPAPGGHDPVH